MKTLLCILISLTTILAGSAQTVVKMSLPPLPESPLEVVTLFDEGIPLNKTVVLGAMGYKIFGGTSPYTLQWLKNNQVVATGDIAVIKPETGATYALKVTDKNNCYSEIAINVDASKNTLMARSPNILVTPTMVTDRITISFVDNQFAEADVRILDTRGTVRFQTSINGSSHVPLQLPKGNYYVVVNSKLDYSAEKIFIH